MYRSEAWVAQARGDFWYRHQMPIRYRALDNLCGLNHMFHTGCEEYIWAHLDKFLPDIERRKILFKRERYFVTDVMENPQLKKINRAWSLTARCLSCGNNKFLPVMLEKEYAVCYHCIPPSQYPSIGGTLVKKSYIDEYIERTYSVACPESTDTNASTPTAPSQNINSRSPAYSGRSTARRNVFSAKATK